MMLVFLRFSPEYQLILTIGEIWAFFVICNIFIKFEKKSMFMVILTERRIREYYEANPASKSALQDWTKKVKEAEWKTFEDIKKTFNSVDYVGNQHYVFNIKGNDYRMVAVVKFTPQFVMIKFLGTHAEYDK